VGQKYEVMNMFLLNEGKIIIKQFRRER